MRKNDNSWKIEKRKILKKNNDHFQNTIFEIKCITPNKNLIIGVRSWNNLKIYGFHDFEFENINNSPISEYVNYKTRLCNFTFTENRTDELATLHVDKTIKIWNIVKNTLLKSTTGWKTNQTWGKIDYIDANKLIYVNSSSYNIFDLRTGSFVIEQNNTSQNMDYRNLCCNSNSPDNIYLTTNKFTYNIDLRNYCPVNKWAHLLKESIFLSDISVNTYNTSQNIVCVASRNEKILIQSEEAKIAIPKSIPSPSESYNETLSFKSLSAPHCILQRLKLSTTGMK